jgi:hypothetical protein
MKAVQLAAGADLAGGPRLRRALGADLHRGALVQPRGAQLVHRDRRVHAVVEQHVGKLQPGDDLLNQRREPLAVELRLDARADGDVRRRRDERRGRLAVRQDRRLAAE